MTVENTNPIQHFTANGETTVFALSFAVEGKDNIKVTVNGSVVSVNDYSYDALTKAVVFNAAPEDGVEVVVERVTSLDRSINYQTYNNSFRPETLNYDLDRLWYAAQELHLKDNKLDEKIQKFRDDVNLTALEDTLEQAQEIHDNTAILANEVQANLNQSQTLLTQTTQQANAANTSATDANTAKNQAQQAVVDANAINATTTQALYSFQNGAIKAYPTLADANADIANIALNTKISVLSSTEGGDYYKASSSATTLTKSSYDVLTQSKSYADANAIFNPIQLSNENLNDLAVGFYILNNPPANAVDELNYPLSGQCYIQVIKTKTSQVKHQIITYTTANRVFYRYYNGTTWTTTERLTAESINTSLQNFATVKPKHAQQANLNDLSAGFYIQSTINNVTLENNYPIVNKLCFINVVENTSVSSAKLQSIYYPDSNRSFCRYFNGITWTTKELSTNIAAETITPAMLAKTVSNALTPHLEFVKVGSSGSLTFTQSTRTLAWTHMLLAPYAGVSSKRIRIDIGSVVIPDSAYQYLYIDLDTIPTDGNISADLLKIGSYGGTGFSVTPNQIPLVKTDGEKKILSCSGFLPIIHTESNGAEEQVEGKDTFKFVKTAISSYIYLPCSDSNSLFRIRFYRQVKPFDGVASQSQSDIWRLGAASLVAKKTLNETASVVQDGEWDTAIRVSGAGDHSGGVHGDELQTEAYFLVNGCYCNQDAVIDKDIKELIYVQKSNIYFEHTQNILAERLKVMTITKDGIHNYQKIQFKASTSLETAWITMLPIRRKQGTNNDGEQVTDTVIRFPGYEIENITETGFTQKYTDTQDGSKFVISGTTSGISATVKLFNFKGLPKPTTHISSAVQYNKLYFSAISGRGVLYTVSPDETWEVESQYTFDQT